MVTLVVVVFIGAPKLTYADSTNEVIDVPSRNSFSVDIDETQDFYEFSELSEQQKQDVIEGGTYQENGLYSFFVVNLSYPTLPNQEIQLRGPAAVVLGTVSVSKTDSWVASCKVNFKSSKKMKKIDYRVKAYCRGAQKTEYGTGQINSTGYSLSGKTYVYIKSAYPGTYIFTLTGQIVATDGGIGTVQPAMSQALSFWEIS
ncbi:hypothetical protein BAU18_001628 [Enterococcus diestrammenae]|uniref:Uncharacterized protein n=2 Tax=Enterococcus TaxID=1350 RepID=A0ABV0F263_9ENTE|nr:hypothetical protein BAU18_08460 [Enterococcus diestrammenae]